MGIFYRGKCRQYNDLDNSGGNYVGYRVNNGLVINRALGPVALATTAGVPITRFIRGFLRDTYNFKGAMIYGIYVGHFGR